MQENILKQLKCNGKRRTIKKPSGKEQMEQYGVSAYKNNMKKHTDLM